MSSSDTGDPQHDAPTTSTTAVRVPELVGAPASEGHDRALDAGVLAVAENAAHTGGGRAVIARQDPEAGVEVGPGSIVRIWISA